MTGEGAEPMAGKNKKGGRRRDPVGNEESKSYRKYLRGRRIETKRVDRTADIKEIQQRLQKRPKRRKANIGRLLIAILLMVIQLGILIWGLYQMKMFVLSSYLFFQIVSAIAVIRIVLNHKNPSYKIAWIAVILLVPFLGLIFYLMWGRGSYPNRIKKHIPVLSEMTIPLYEHNREVEMHLFEQYPEQERVMNYLHRAGFPIYQKTSVRYFDLGDKFFPALMDDIKKAEKFVFLEFFILSEGSLWQELFELLKKKAAEGVDVRILYDDFGCITCLPKRFEAITKEAGIQTAVFNKIKPIVNNFYLNYRNHQKICVIDGNLGYTGGVNIADEYVNTVDAFGHWKDSGIRLAGNGVWSLTITFLQMWEYATYHKKMIKKNDDYKVYAPDEKYCAKFKDARGFVQPFADGPLTTPNETEAEYLYMQMINSAKSYVYITTPYLVPDNEMRTALRMAALSGVDVRIITPGVPDKKYVYLVTNSFYGVLIRAGVRIYEYVPGFIHAKNIVCDDETAIVGTVNMDFRSFYLHFENGVWMCGNHAVSEVREDFLKTLEYCREIDLPEWQKRPFKRKIAQAVLNFFAPLL